MTTDQKKQALIDAGVKVRSNASEETVEELYEEHLVAIAEHGPIVTEDIEPVEDESSEVSSAEPEDAMVPIPVPSPSRGRGKATMADFKKIRDTLGTTSEGTRTPAVFEWADKNLPAAEFNEIYAGKFYNGEIIKAKS